MEEKMPTKTPKAGLGMQLASTHEAGFEHKVAEGKCFETVSRLAPNCHILGSSLS